MRTEYRCCSKIRQYISRSKIGVLRESDFRILVARDLSIVRTPPLAVRGREKVPTSEERSADDQHMNSWERGAKTDLLGALLLLEHLLLLRDGLGFVFDDKGKGETDQEGGGCDDPDDVANHF